jgi:hypothetical protein
MATTLCYDSLERGPERQSGERLHKEVCAKIISLTKARPEIKTDWRIPCRRYFGEPVAGRRYASCVRDWSSRGGSERFACNENARGVRELAGKWVKSEENCAARDPWAPKLAGIV